MEPAYLVSLDMSFSKTAAPLSALLLTFIYITLNAVLRNLLPSLKEPL